MNPWLATCILLADGNRADQFVKGFREGTLHRTADYNWLLFAVAGVTTALACYAIDRFWRSRKPGPQGNERGLFQDLCHAHGLDRASAGLLQRIARRAQLRHAAEVFVRPELFQPEDACSQRDQDRLAKLRERLFAA